MTDTPLMTQTPKSRPAKSRAAKAKAEPTKALQAKAPETKAPETKAPETKDFGASTAFGAHLFRVDIPPARSGAVVIAEDYGYRGLEGGIPQGEDRVVLQRHTWAAIADIARREFNDRLKAAKLTTGRWHTGTNLVDRLLGKELCVLAWAAETADADQVPVICSKWAALRPEERWWLFAMTVAEAGLPEDTQRGWRRALFYALSDGEKPPSKRKRPRPEEHDILALPLFTDAP